MITRPEGIMLVTGPTGSGKTTTLYSILSALNTERVNIMTLEDPVEYPMPMIRQTSGGRLEARFRVRHPLHDAPGSRRDSGGRNSRLGHGQHGVARGDDGPPGLQHAAHQLGAGRPGAADGSGLEPGHPRRQFHRRDRPAADTPPLPQLQEALPSEFRPTTPAGTRSRQHSAAVRGRRLRRIASSRDTTGGSR